MAERREIEPRVGQLAPKLDHGQHPDVVDDDQLALPRRAGQEVRHEALLEDAVLGAVYEHHAGAVVDPDTRDFQIDPVGRRRVVAYVERWLPGLTPETRSATTCLYSTTPTEDFLIERRGNLVIAAGFSGHGFKFTPLIGHQLAALATGPESGEG